MSRTVVNEASGTVLLRTNKINSDPISLLRVVKQDFRFAPHSDRTADIRKSSLRANLGPWRSARSTRPMKVTPAHFFVFGTACPIAGACTALFAVVAVEVAHPHARPIAEPALLAAVDVEGGAVPLPDCRTVSLGRAELDALLSGRGKQATQTSSRASVSAAPRTAR